MDASFVPVAGLDDLARHLDDLLSTASRVDNDTPRTIDAALFDQVELQVTDANVAVLVPRLLPKIVAVLRQPPVSTTTAAMAERDASVLASLAAKLLRPIRFADVLALASADDLVAALAADAAPATNVLAMTVLHKAAEEMATVEVGVQQNPLMLLADMPELFAAFLARWLAAPAVEVGEKGGRVLGDLLDVDCPLAVPPSPPPARPLVNGTRAILVEEPMGGGMRVLRRTPGPGGLWRRLFHDTAVQGVLTDICGGDSSDSSDERQRSIAQGRLLRLLPRLAALNLTEVAGLLFFAGLRMVDHSDRLMQLSLIDFFETLVSVLRVAPNPDRTVRILRPLLASATAADPLLDRELRSLPDRTVSEEADDLRAWLGRLLPGEVL